MSLLDRLSHKTNNGETRQSLGQSLNGQEMEGDVKKTLKPSFGGLSARLNANHKAGVLLGQEMTSVPKENAIKTIFSEKTVLSTNQLSTKASETEIFEPEKNPADLETNRRGLNSVLGAKRPGLGALSGLDKQRDLSFRLGQRKKEEPELPKIQEPVKPDVSLRDTELNEKKTGDSKESKLPDINNAENPAAQGGLGAKLGLGLRTGLGARLGKKTENPKEVTAASMGKPAFAAKAGAVGPAGAKQDQYQNLKIEIHRQIIEELSIEQQKIIANSSSDRAELEHIVVELCNRVIDGDNPMAMSRADRMNIVNDIVDEVLGLGPIEPLLKDESVSEVMINGPKMVYVERKGKLTLTNVQFQDETHLMNVVERIVAPLGRRIDESSPLVDARLADGSRVNIIIPPLALNGACVTIRKFAKDPLTINNLIGFGSLNEDMAALIKACVLGRLNIVVSGGTGSGKTTTLNVLSSFIPEDERIVTIEDAAELQLRQDHVVTLESRPANVEGNGQVSIRDLVRNALRMRPDRIVVGECRSGEALDMLQAMNTGHDGSLTTAHANSPRDVISRLETMVLMAGMDLPVRAIREQIASAVDLIIQQSRLRDGSRKITYITEVQGMEGDVIVLQDLFRFEQDGLDENGKLKGEFRTSGIRPKFLEKLETNGIKVDGEMFLGKWGGE